MILDVVLEFPSPDPVSARGRLPRALEGRRWCVSGSAEPGRITLLTGPSGSGKTTLLRWLAGLEIPARVMIPTGSQKLQELRELQSLLALPPAQREIAFLFQEPRLLPHFSVIDNVALPAEARGIPRAQALRRAQEILAELGLSEVATSQAHALSGGQAARVALGRALVWKPKLILLDEPLTSLEEELRSSLAQWITTQVADYGVPAILATHLPELWPGAARLQTSPNVALAEDAQA